MAMLPLTHTYDGFWHNLGFGTTWPWHNLSFGTIWAHTHILAMFDSCRIVVARHEMLQTLAKSALAKISCSASV